MNRPNKSAEIAENKADASSRDKSSMKETVKSEGQHAVQSRDLDQAYWYVQKSGSHKNDQASASELKALRRKIDRRIVPVMFCCYTVQFIDKVSLNVGHGLKSGRQR